MGQLLQNETESGYQKLFRFITKCISYYKVWQKFITIIVMYYKVRRNTGQNYHKTSYDHFSGDF